MKPAYEGIRHAIREIFDSCDLTPTQQNSLMRTLAGHTDIDQLTQGQATVVLSSLIARGRDDLAKWADALNRPGKIE